MAIAGIEGLAQGLIQGMALKRQNDRQDVLDAQNLEKFGMDKERFKTQQAASAFELQNAQTNAANAAIDRKRTLAIQKKDDATLANMRKLWSLGDNAEAIHGEVEKLHQANGEQGAYKRDAAGKIITNKSGVATWVNKDGSEVPIDAKGAKMSYWMAANPNEAAKNQLETDNTIAKEGREAKIAKEKDLLNHKQAMELARLNNTARDGNIRLQLDYKEKKDKEKVAKLVNPYLPTAQQFFGSSLKADALVDMASKMTKDEFIKSGMDTFNISNMSKMLMPNQKQEAQATMVRLADAIYGSGNNTPENSNASNLSLLGGMTPTGVEAKPVGATLEFE
jgi:hypothetical protein